MLKKVKLNGSMKTLRPFRTNTQKRYPFHCRGLECKTRKSRNTWNNRQIWPWSTEWSRANASKVLPRERTGHSKHPRNNIREDSAHDITRWSIPKSYWLYSLQLEMEKLHTVSKNKTRSYCGSEHELLIVKFWLKLKKVGKTTWLFRYDWNQIPYDYTVEVTNRFKGLDLIQSAWQTMNRSWRHYTGGSDQDHPQGKEMQKSKMVVWEGLINSCEKKRSKKQSTKGKIYPFEIRVPKNSKER